MIARTPITRNGDNRLCGCIAADADHQLGDLIGAVRLGAPEAVAIGLEDEFAFGVGAPGHRRGFRVARGENPNFGIRQRLAVWVANCTVTSCRVPKRSKAAAGDAWQSSGNDRDPRLSAPASCRHAVARPAALVAQAGRGRRMPDFGIERRCTGLVCGVDEAGRGPLAGPVVAAAVILDPRRFPKSSARRARQFEGAEHRGARGLLPARCGDASIAGPPASGSARRASPKSTASTFCARRCWRWRAPWRVLGVRPDIALVDGNIAPPLDLRRADRRQGRRPELLDRRRLGRRQGDPRPHHARLSRRAIRFIGWETNVGYATPEHGEAIRRIRCDPPSPALLRARPPGYRRRGDAAAFLPASSRGLRRPSAVRPAASAEIACRATFFIKVGRACSPRRSTRLHIPSASPLAGQRSRARGENA